VREFTGTSTLSLLTIESAKSPKDSVMSFRNEVEARLRSRPLYSQESESDPIVYCKLFHVFGSGTWYLTEYDGIDVAFGYVTGLLEDEWGYVSITELERLTLAGTIPRIECDLHFDPVQFAKLRLKEKF
jgi:Protein of unknown function (DUF2958)